MGGSMDYYNDICENMKWVYHINTEGCETIWKLDPNPKSYYITLYIL